MIDTEMQLIADFKQKDFIKKNIEILESAIDDFNKKKQDLQNRYDKVSHLNKIARLKPYCLDLPLKEHRYSVWHYQSLDNMRRAEIYLNVQNKKTYGLRLYNKDKTFEFYREAFLGSDFTKKYAMKIALDWILEGKNSKFKRIKDARFI